jgi:hypothetical protein
MHMLQGDGEKGDHKTELSKKSPLSIIGLQRRCAHKQRGIVDHKS